NRVISKRHSRDRFDRIGSFSNDNGEKDGSLPNNIASFDRGGPSGTNNSSNNNTESLTPGIVRVHGCSNSELAKTMSDRWAAAVHSCNDPSLDATERPVVYSSSGGGSGWGSSKLAHQSPVFWDSRMFLWPCFLGVFSVRNGEKREKSVSFPCCAPIPCFLCFSPPSLVALDPVHAWNSRGAFRNVEEGFSERGGLLGAFPASRAGLAWWL
ncbi:hypothetical protein KI387_023223, partial [Taxus chinensis]